MTVGNGCLGSLVGALFGTLFFVGSFPLHWWNEHRAVTTERSLDEGRHVFQRADVTNLDRGNDGKLIYVSGDARAPGPLLDAVTHITVPALVLERVSEMYQWDEESSKRSGNHDHSYSYECRWKSGIENSAHFHEKPGHRNPDRYVIPSGTETVPEAKLGAFRVPAAILQKIDATTPWQPEEKQLSELPAELRARSRIAGGQLYLGKDPAVPEVGDERVAFRIVAPGPISILARQSGDLLAEHTASNGRALVLAEAGVVAPETLFEHAFTANRTLTWILRVVGLFAMFIGARLIIEPLTNVTDWIPLLGGVVDTGATLAAGVFALVFSAITIAVSWFAVRPLLSCGLVVAAIGVALLAKKARSRPRDPAILK